MSSKNKLTRESLISFLDSSWSSKLDLDNVPFDDIVDVLNSGPFYPKVSDIFNALNNCKPSNTKIVIIGQDPYHSPNTAHGYSFSVPKSAEIPPSLKNIHKELMLEYGITTIPNNGCLIPWVNEGVLLLNTILTVKPGLPKSHKKIGWETFTSNVIKYLDKHTNCVFMAWGKDAIKLCSDHVNKNEVVACGHPSPLNSSANVFVGSDCFKKANEALMKRNILPVRWTKLWKVNEI